VLWPSESEAREAARGPLNIAYCRACAHVFNKEYDPNLADYGTAYENSLHYSPLFNEYAKGLAQRLIDRYSLRGKRIVEIGCGKGDFLRMLCEAGGNVGYGFDRSFEPERSQTDVGAEIAYFQDNYTGELAAQCRPDLLCFRHVLEHIDRPIDFLADLRNTIGDREDVVLYCEVPNALYTLKELGIWDLIYEHCGYFTLHSLVTAFQRAGYDVIAGDEAFGGQFVWVEAKVGAGHSRVSLPNEQGPTQIQPHADTFADQYRSSVRIWQERLAGFTREGRLPVVWGAGSKGVTFLNVLKGVGTEIQYVVDVNPHKEGRHIPVTAQRVVPPGFLSSYPATDVLVMNPLYLGEIEAAVREMGLDLRFSTV
jgi:SAM-dependent methyltransferase